DTGSRVSRADALIYAGHLETLHGDVQLAFGMLEESAAIAAEAGARSILTNARSQLAYAYVRRRAPGDLLRAERSAQDAADVAREAKLPGFEIQARSRVALALFEGGDARAALAPSQHAVHMLDKVRHMEWS